jgi:hypothetical protein
MRRPFHAILALFFVAWLPFCCCQVSAATAAVVREASHAKMQRGGVAPACCTADAPSAPDSDASGAAVGEDDTPDSCCRSGHRAPGAPHAPAKAPCASCFTCKDRVLPAEPSVPPLDTVGALLMALPPALDAAHHAIVAPALLDRRGTGPPGPVTGRLHLALACILQV